MDLVNSFENFCKYILRYKSRFHQLSNSELGFFKRNQDYKTVKSAVYNIDISVSNLSSSLNHILLKIPIGNIKNNTYEILKSLVEDNPNFGGSSGVLGNTQINKLKELKNQVESQFESSPLVLNQNRSNNDVHDQNSQLEMLSETEIKNQLDEAKGLYKRTFKKSLSLKIFQYHSQNGTAPKEISIHNFPPPFLPHDKDFVKEYDTLIKSFQTQIMDLCVNRVNQQLITLKDRISSIKTYLTSKNVQNVDSKLEDIRINTENTWKTIGDSSMEKAQRIIIKSFTVRQINNQNVSMDEVWFHRDTSNTQQNDNQNQTATNRNENATHTNTNQSNNDRHRSRSRGHSNNRNSRNISNNRHRSNSNRNRSRNFDNNQEFRNNYNTPNNPNNRSNYNNNYNNSFQQRNRNHDRRSSFNNGNSFNGRHNYKSNSSNYNNNRFNFNT